MCHLRRTILEPMRLQSVLLVLGSMLGALAQGGMGGAPGMGGGTPPKKVKPSPLNEDLPYIKCEVCEKMAVEAYQKVTNLVRAAPEAREAKRRFDADPEKGELGSKVEDLLTRMCDADNDGREGRTADGMWMSKLDIVKQGQALKLAQRGPGHCRRECRTIAKACDDVLSIISDGDADLSEVLLGAARAGQSEGMLRQRVCIKMAGVCKKGRVPLWPQGKARKNEEFKPKSEKEQKLDLLMATMKDAPGGGANLGAMGMNDMDLGIDAPIDPIDVLKDEI